MTTFRKLPITAPSRKINTYAKKSGKPVIVLKEVRRIFIDANLKIKNGKNAESRTKEFYPFNIINALKRKREVKYP